MARRSDGESVLHKHLRILESFDTWHPFLTLTEIADAADLAPSSAHRLVGELEREGLLERMPDKTYRLGIRLWEFASRTPGALGLREIARPWLAAVHARVRQHIQLGVLNSRDVLFIERLSARDAVLNATLIGGRIPLPVSSSGLVLLAHASDALVDDVIAHGWPIHTTATIPDGDALRRMLRKVRADGFAVTPGHIHPESRGVAVPVYGPHGSVYAAIGVVIPNDDTSPQAAVEMLTMAATGITHALEEAYLPEGGSTHAGPGLRALVSSSQRSLDYFSSLEPDAAARGTAAASGDLA